ncbi:MAG: Tex family protein [bacterium]|nr:Tex family protein [bacterium]
MDIIAVLAQELNIRQSQAEAAVKLIDEGNTIPFIARYRKEVTGSLNDEVLRSLDERLHYLRNLEERKGQVIEAIREQEKLTAELERQILDAKTLVAVEDLYLPYRPKRRTRAMIAKEKGLEPFAEQIRSNLISQPLELEAQKYLSDEKGVHTPQEAMDGARDILAEWISDTAEYRTRIREMTLKEGVIQSTAKDEKTESVYEMYYQYEEPLKKCAGHRVLAMNRGEKEKILTVKVVAPKEQILEYLERQVLVRERGQSKEALRAKTGKKPTETARLAGKAVGKPAGAVFTEPLLKEAILDSYDRLIAPAIEREIRNALTEAAEDGAMKVFGKNLEQLLMQPPIVGNVVLGWDPAFRTGCKLAVVDGTGKVLDTAVIYPTAPQNKVVEAKKVLKRLIETYHVTLISVGNGTASRESEQIIAEFLREIPQKVQYVIVNEAGASVYSASKLATEEFPQFDVAQRSAVSIARRLQDPLSELVKIDPKSIGVGQYQHDMNQKRLGEVLGGVVEDCVNKVGVDLNTASASLLEYISGISKALAKNIVAYREENGAFTNRRQLLKVAKLGPKAFEQCAGFLRISGGENPLDGTSVHPESYEAAKKLLKKLGFEISDVAAGGIAGISKKLVNPQKLADELGIGEITLADIVSELEKPARDPRNEMPKPILRTDVLEMKDLKPGMILKGTVRNVIDFGAFVDIGVHQDGLVHISQMVKRYIKHPLEAVSVGDIVEVKVLSVDPAKKRIALSMLLEG